MSLVHVFILSLVEGITEFLPISSTGHLILAARLLGIQATNFTKTFEISIQLGAIMAVVVLYFKKFLQSIDLYKKLVVAFVPTTIVGFFFYPFIKGYLLGSSRLVTGLNREKATEFSFLLAVPTMIAASFLDIYKSLSYLNSTNIPSLLLGSFISFGVYRIILALLFWMLVK
jgi:undecaprenyl pyrophosphate phosphatase UppP